MNDMSAVIVPKSDQINADDLIAGPRTYQIDSVDVRPGAEQPVNIRLVGEDRVWRPCKSMSRVLVAAWGPNSKDYTGKSLTLYRDPKVKWGGMEIGGIRVSHMSHIERDMLLQLTATKGKRAPHVVKPLVMQQAGGDARAVQDLARQHARAGTESFTSWWNSDDGKAARAVVRPIMDEIKDLCATADAATNSAEDDPFGQAEHEGPDDSQRGESFNDTLEENGRVDEMERQGEEAPAYLTEVRKVREKLAAAKTAKAVDGIDRDWCAALRGQVEEADSGLMASVDRDINSRRRELRAQAEG